MNPERFTSRVNLGPVDEGVGRVMTVVLLSFAATGLAVACFGWTRKPRAIEKPSKNHPMTQRRSGRGNTDR
jgi:hypothetical protein